MVAVFKLARTVDCRNIAITSPCMMIDIAKRNPGNAAKRPGTPQKSRLRVARGGNGPYGPAKCSC